MAAVFVGPVVAQVDHEPRVGVPTAEIVGGTVPRLLPSAAGIEMPVIGVHVDEFVDMRVGVERAVPRMMGPGNDLPEMTVDRVDEEAVAEGVPVMAPGVRRAVTESLKTARTRRVSPDAPLEPHAILGGGPRRTDAAGAGATAAAVEPAFGAETQAVGEVVVVFGRNLEPVEDHLCRAVGNIVAVTIGHKQQSWWAEQPDAAEPDLHARQLLEVVEKNLPFVGHAVAVVVFEDEHPVAEPGVHLDRPFGVGVVLRDPEPTAGIPGHRNRIQDVWFGREYPDTKPLRHLHGGGGLCGWQRHRGRVFFTVERRRKAFGPAPGRCRQEGEECCRHEGSECGDHGESVAPRGIRRI